MGGVLLSAGLPPFGWWPLALVGSASLARALTDARAGRRMAVGVVAGMGFLGPGLAWLTEFHIVGFAGAVVLEVVLFALAMAMVPPGRWQVLGLPGALVLLDAFRGIWPFGGVPIATLAQTQVGGPLAEAARLGGEALVGVLVALAGVALAELSRRHLVRFAVVGAVVASTIGVAAIAPQGRAAGEVNVAVIQVGGQRGLRAVEGESGPGLATLVATTAELAPGTDVVVWPEDGVRVDGDVRRSPRSTQVGALAADLGATIVSGVSESRGDVRRNLAVAWSGDDGTLVGRYRKNKVVPFGERIPFRSTVERFADTSAVPRDVVPGRGAGLLVTPAGDLGVVISFEVFFASRTRAALLEGAEVVLVPTNASSYPTTQMPALELGAARLRALETGRSVIQSAPTGFSAIVGPDGDVRARSDLGEEAVLSERVERRVGWTLATRLGPLPLVVAAGAALGGGWVITLVDRRRRRSGPKITQIPAVSRGQDAS